MQSYAGQEDTAIYSTIQANIGLSRTKQDYMGPYGTIRNRMGLYRTIQDHRGSYGTIRTLGEYTELSGTNWDHT